MLSLLAVYKRSLCVAAAAASAIADVVVVVVASAFVTRDTKEISSTALCMLLYHFIFFLLFIMYFCIHLFNTVAKFHLIHLLGLFCCGAIKIIDSKYARTSVRLNVSCTTEAAVVAAAMPLLLPALAYLLVHSHTNTHSRTQRLFTLTTANCLPSAVSFSFSFLPTARSVAEHDALSLAHKLSLGECCRVPFALALALVVDSRRVRRRCCCR